MKNEIKIDYTNPGSPYQNGFIESFNGKMRDECLRGSYFFDLKDAKNQIETWRIEYNNVRPHSSLEHKTPAQFIQEFMARDREMEHRI